MLASPIARPFPQFTPFFIATGLPKAIQTNTAQQNHVLQPPIQLLADLEYYQQSESLLACKQHKKTAKQCENASNFKTTPPPLEFSQATPNWYQMIALCLCNNITLSLTEAPLKKISWLNGGIFSGISTDFCQFQEVVWSPWLRAGGG